MKPVVKVLTTISWGLMVALMVCLLAASLRRQRPAAIAEAPQFDLIDQNGRPATLKSLVGKAWIADLIYTHCAGPCPTMTLKMTNLEKSIASAGLRFVSFTVDPEHDTPAVLKEYAKKFDADESRWSFLTGSSDEIQKAARGLLVTAIPADGDNPIIHDERFILVDADGKICGYYASRDGQAMDKLKRDAEALGAEARVGMTDLNYQVPQIVALRSLSSGKAMTIILTASAAVVAFLFWLLYFKPAATYAAGYVPVLPAVNAALNTLSAVFLVMAYVAVKRRQLKRHMQLIFAALGCSTLFFISYVVYHSFHGDSKFAGHGTVRPIYFFILISHILLSAVAVPMILTSLYLALSGKLAIHRRVSSVTFPVWLYVSVTGVVIFVMLKTYNG